ncbi:MAG: hypothetical protein AAF512_08220 [Pseudomonadota bacterium]
MASTSVFADDELRTCREIKNIDVRVACYDRIVDTRYPTSDSNSQVLSPKATEAVEAIETTQNQSTTNVQDQANEVVLNKTLDKKAEVILPVEAFGKPKVIRNQREEISAVVTQIKQSAYKKLTVTLDNQQVWRQLDSSRMRLKKDDEITIRSSSLGSYQLRKSGGGTSIRVKRIK